MHPQAAGSDNVRLTFALLRCLVENRPVALADVGSGVIIAFGSYWFFDRLVPLVRAPRLGRDHQL